MWFRQLVAGASISDGCRELKLGWVGAERRNMASVTGPISGGARGCAFGASTRSLDAVGYVEQEFFLEGDATLFSLTSEAEYAFDGHWPIVARGKVPFRTRLLVRRPSDPQRFNGMVVLNWNNVSRG